MASYTGQIAQQTTSITSTTSPTIIIPCGFMGRGYNIKNRTTSSNHVLVWAFTGTATPNSVPANVREVAIGENFGDTISGAESGADAGIGQGWAAVLETAGSATVDTVWS